MDLLILAVVTLVVLALVIWLIDSAPIGDIRIKWAIKALAVLIALVFVVQRAGLA